MKNDLNPFANQDVILKTIKETMRRENELRGYARINFMFTSKSRNYCSDIFIIHNVKIFDFIR